MPSSMSCRAQSRHPIAIASDISTGVESLASHTSSAALQLRLRFASLRMIARFISVLSAMIFAAQVVAQSVDVVRPEQHQKARQAVAKAQEKRARQASIIEFRGEQAFDEKTLRSVLKEEITTVQDLGLSPARADDLAFFLEVFYRKHGYAKVDIHYTIESADRLRLDVNEGPRFLLRTVIFEGNAHEPADKLFEYMAGPTRERYSRLEKRVPFVAADLEECTRL